MPRILERLSGAVATALLSAALAGVVQPACSQVQSTNTGEIVTETLGAIPSCLQWQLRGVCLWLRCSGYYCRVETTLRVAHYIPEVVVSTYHEPTLHPWGDYGSVVTKALSGAGSTLLSLDIDSAGSSTKTQEQFVFRDADAIGNPLVGFADMVAGEDAQSNKAVTFPDPTQLLLFPTQIPAIIEAWANLPSTVSSAVVGEARRLADLPSKVGTIMSGIAKVQSIAGTLASGPISMPELGTIELGPLRTIADLVGATGNSGSQAFCPGSTTPFGINFQSHFDALTWRGVLPVEMLYPQSWIPGLAEIGDFPRNTWGNMYPRHGQLTQAHPVKSSAVLAARIGDFITKTAQPHIYKPLVRSEAFRFFGPDDDIIWQRLHPRPERTCTRFGENDSLGLASWGDGATSAPEGYSWNLWRRAECCQVKGVFLGSIGI